MSCEVCDLKQGQAMVIRVQASSPEILDIPKETTLESFQKFVGRDFAQHGCQNSGDLITP